MALVAATQRFWRTGRRRPTVVDPASGDVGACIVVVVVVAVADEGAIPSIGYRPPLVRETCMEFVLGEAPNGLGDRLQDLGPDEAECPPDWTGRVFVVVVVAEAELAVMFVVVLVVRHSVAALRGHLNMLE